MCVCSSMGLYNYKLTYNGEPRAVGPVGPVGPSPSEGLTRTEISCGKSGRNRQVVGGWFIMVDNGYY